MRHPVKSSNTGRFIFSDCDFMYRFHLGFNAKPAVVYCSEDCQPASSTFFQINFSSLNYSLLDPLSLLLNSKTLLNFPKSALDVKTVQFVVQSHLTHTCT